MQILISELADLNIKNVLNNELKSIADELEGLAQTTEVDVDPAFYLHVELVFLAKHRPFVQLFLYLLVQNVEIVLIVFCRVLSSLVLNVPVD